MAKVLKPVKAAENEQEQAAPALRVSGRVFVRLWGWVPRVRLPRIPIWKIPLKVWALVLSVLTVRYVGLPLPLFAGSDLSGGQTLCSYIRWDLELSHKQLAGECPPVYFERLPDKTWDFWRGKF